MSTDLRDLSRPHALVFDLDGTLVDTVEQRIEAWRRAFEEAGIPADRGLLAPLIGSDGRRLAREVAERAGRSPTDDDTEVLDRRSGEIFDELNADPRPLPGVRDLLAAADRAGLPWVIATSSRREQVQRSVRALGLDRQPRIVDGTTVKRAKPAPDLLLEAAELVSTPPPSCWCIGDSTWDVQAGIAAGMVTVGVLAGSAVDRKSLGNAGATAVVESLESLVQALSSRGPLGAV